LRMAGNSIEAEDLTRDIFLQVFRKIRTFRGGAAFSTWLHRLAVNIVLMRLRKKAPAQISLEEATEPNEEGGKPHKNLREHDPRVTGLLDCVNIVRILVVDDSEPFRHFIRSFLGKRAELQIIGEATEGLESVYKSEELQPDLILLDIGLPILNGFQVARRICKLAPESKIVFLSQESSADIVRGALSLGARGYVVKANAARDLLVALETIVQGKKFVSAGLTDQILTDTG